MKCMIPEISWHNREPVLCVDIQPIENDFYRLATGGSDYHVLIWQGKISDNGAVTLDIISDLTRHQRAVNVVRWSPNGQYLASADDDANIIIWNLKTDNIPLLDGETNDKETWLITKIMRGHKEDIYDLCWAPSGLKLLSGSIDNTAIIWDFNKGKLDTILTDHKGFVQGVCWDPKGEYLATLSSDRICRIYEGSGKQIRARINRGTLPVSDKHPLYQKEVKYFHDDTFKSFFRRITFSPDGSLVIAPAGCVETEENKKALCGTYIFTLDCLTQPVAMLPLQKQCSVAVKCCPILFELRSDGPSPTINLPYRMVIAVATESDLILYDTQQLTPFAHLQKIHYTRLTDLSWSIDGRLLTACSTDGFCTLVTFDPDELGTPYTKEESEEVEDSFMNVSGCEELEKEPVDVKVKDEKPKKESFLVQWANKVKSTEIDGEEIKENKDENVIEETKKEENVANGEEVIEILDSPVKEIINVLIPKRIIPIRLGSAERKRNSPANKATPTRKKKKNLDNSTSKEKSSKCLTNFLKVTTTDKEKPIVYSESITQDSTSARDSWNVDDIKKNPKDIEQKETIEIEDDLAESIPDLDLQLEESVIQETQDQSKLGNDKNPLNESKKDELKLSESDKNTKDKKAHRRIQLITLSSPKHKKRNNT